MSVIGSNILAGSAGQGGGYTIERSLRLRSSASAYLNRTPASAGNRKTWTWSGWVKRGALGIDAKIIDAGTNASTNSRQGIRFNTSDVLFFDNQNVGSVSTTAVFRDASAWYHIVMACDTTQATTNDRLKLYVNGNLQAWSGTVPLSSSLDTQFNNSTPHKIGVKVDNTQPFDGYLAEVNFIDGQALTPSSFGNYNEDTGVWQPAKYAGSYGTNGFYLPFSDNTTTTTLAADASGNGNDWTPNNISLTSGATYDSMTDTPTPYADGGNYAVLNPLDTQSGVLSNANLTVATSSSNYSPTRATISVTSGKWYWEVVIGSGTSTQIGIYSTNELLNTAVGSNAGSYGYYSATGQKVNNNSYTAYGASYTTGDVIGHALDMDSGTLTFYKNNTSQGTAFSGLSGQFAPAVSDASTAGTQSITANFGQRPFAYTPPSGFLPLHTGNLPDSAIVDGSQYFNATTYTGNGTTQSIVNSGGMQPDLVWVKDRTVAYNHILANTGAGITNFLSSNTTSAESSTAGLITAVNTNGFSVGSVANVNASGNAYVGWQWKANAAGVSNTDGSITSTVSANPTSGFSVVTYTGNGTNPGATIGHGLGVSPAMIIAKSRSATSEWPSYHKALPISNTVYLNATYASSTYINRFSAVSSTTFTTGSSGGELNTSGVTYVAYCFAEVPGFSKFGSYTGNGSSDGPFVFTNFRPAFVMTKRTNSTGNWILQDVKRDENTNVKFLYPNLSNSEDTGAIGGIDFLSNGFKVTDTWADHNANGGTYIFMAFAEHPFKNALAR